MSLKQVLKTDRARRILCWIAAQYIRLVRYTGRWDLRGEDLAESFWAAGKPFIVCFWHGRILMMPYGWRRQDSVHMLISQHRDGQLIARTVGHFGIKTVAGSTRRGGSAALRSMLKVLKDGQYVGFTPDGPRGPRMRASIGIVQTARMAGVPIIPVSFGARGRWVTGSWDRMVVPKPFTRGVILWGRPIEVPRDADEAALESLRLAVEDGLNALTVECDRLCGHAPIEPAPAEPADEA